ncbi:hypothetical protein [Streptomyces sp. NPDC054834]
MTDRPRTCPGHTGCVQGSGEGGRRPKVYESTDAQITVSIPTGATNPWRTFSWMPS